MDTVTDITVANAPTGRARCVCCKKLIPYKSLKLSIAYDFYAKAKHKWGGGYVTSHRSCCESCSEELLDGKPLKRKLGRSVVEKVSLELISHFPIRKILQNEMDEWLGGVRL